MLNVAYFSNQFADLQGHGLARYSRELFAGLQNVDADIHIQPVASWSSKGESELAKLRSETGLEILPWGRKLTPFCWAFLNGPPIERWLSTETDVVHSLALGYPVATRKPLVVTVHDLGPLTHPEYFKNTSPWIMRRSLNHTIKQAAAIVCVSQSTADELISLVGDSARKRIHVVHEGVSPDFFRPAHAECLRGIHSLPVMGTPFILSTGKLSPRKNVLGLIRAMTRLADHIPHHLVLVGGDGWSVEETYDLLDESGLRDRVHFPGFVSDDQLRGLYNAASVYVHPSFYEGFGLTILEAMASGCPVVTSNVYSLPEVAGKAALLIDPGNVDEIAFAIKRICQNESIAVELKEKGIRRAEEFRWDSCAEKIANIYQQVAL
jgi:glycosyltransferase involved in cell wall biosynthesis